MFVFVEVQGRLKWVIVDLWHGPKSIPIREAWTLKIFSAHQRTTTRMPRRRREEGNGDQSGQQKRLKSAPSDPRPTRTHSVIAVEVSTPKRNKRTARGKTSDPPPRDIIEISSNSDSLSSPPSIVVAPTPLKSPPSKPLTNRTNLKRAPSKKGLSKNVTPKEHDDALSFFARDDSDEENSSNASESNQANGVHSDLNSDEDEEDWEDVDLSHKRHISLEDLNNVTEVPDLEVTLERTQHSMRIKFSLVFPYLI